MDHTDIELLDKEVEETDKSAEVDRPKNSSKKKQQKKSSPPLTKKQKKVIQTVNNILCFLIVTVILVGLTGLAAEYIVVKGPSPSLRDTFVLTALETRRFGFMANIFLSDDDIAEIRARNTVVEESVETIDTSLIHLPNQEGQNDPGDTPEEDPYGLVDEDGDGLILDPVSRKSFSGYMMIILDPSRVFVGRPEPYGYVGLTVKEMVEKYGAAGGINGGGFTDETGFGLGGSPAGLAVVGGVYFNEDSERDSFVGFDQDGYLHVGYYTAEDARAAGIRDGVAFGPILISNGSPTTASTVSSGLNPRTAIGQRADGAVLMLVIDGRQGHSIGCDYSDLADVMMDYGAVNACNLDGGSSSVLYYDGAYVNSPSSDPRPLPTGFLFR